MSRRKGIIFTVIFSLMFMGFLSVVLLASNFFSNSEASFVSARRTLRVMTLSDNAASNLAGLLDLSVTAARNGKNVTFSFADHLPSRDASPAAELASYESFFENAFATKLNLNVSLNTNALAASPYVYANGSAVNYSYGSLGKSVLNISIPGVITAYSITLRFDGAEAVNDTNWFWTGCSLPCSGTDILVMLNVSNRTTGTPLPIAGCTSGFVAASGVGRFGINSTSPEILNVTKSTGSLTVRVAPAANTDSIISVSVNSTAATTVVLPVSLSIANLTGGNSTVPALQLLRI
jgi:hypothetical protein